MKKTVLNHEEKMIFHSDYVQSPKSYAFTTNRKWQNHDERNKILEVHKCVSIYKLISDHNSAILSMIL